MAEKILYTTQDLVELLSLCKNEILLAVKNGELKAIKRGNKYLFKKEYIDEFVLKMEENDGISISWISW